MHVIKAGRNRSGRDIGDITVKNDSGIEDNDTDVSDARMRRRKMLCMSGTGDETRLRHERYLYAQLSQAPYTQSVYGTTASQSGLHERGARG